MAAPIDEFIPNADVRERFSIVVRAPSDVVYQVASEFDMQSPLIVRTIFWLRAIVTGAKTRARPAHSFFDEMRALGWGCLAERRGEFFVAGAACQPWQPDVEFAPILPALFATFSEPGKIKIAWTIETEFLGHERTCLATETRVVATDESARRKFLMYWRWARFGIIPIRWVMIPAIRKSAERQWRRQKHAA